MSKKPSENQKSGRKFTESYLYSNSATATSNEENSLERRLFSLIGNELRQTTAENEFATLENRIIRILRNEFVNDIMMEINTSNDEIAIFFNRFISSVPELHEICDRTGTDQPRREYTLQTRKDKVEMPKKYEEKNKEKKEKIRASGCLDENNIRIVLEMFRAPILVTCRACEDMRRIIRSGRRMIREIQLIASMRGDLNNLRRMDMKCFDDLDNVGNTRYRRQMSNNGNWRQVFRHRCSIRNIQPSSCREQGCYYVVFDRPDKPRIASKISAKCTMIIKLRKKVMIYVKKTSKQSTKLWDEYSAKAEISRVIQTLRCACLRSCMNYNTSEQSNTEGTLFPDLVNNLSQSAADNRQDNSAILYTNTIRETVSTSSPTIIPESTGPTPAVCPISMVCEDQVQLPITPPTLMSPEQEETSPEISGTPVSARINGPSPVGDGSREFSVMLRTGSAQPQDVTVVLHSDRVLVASVAQRSRAVVGGWSGWLQRRWVLPEHVDVDNIRCYLGGGSLVITEFPLSDFQWAFISEFVALGPPSRHASPYPYPFQRRA